MAKAAKVNETIAQMWLKRQTLWQLYLPAPRYIPRPMSNEVKRNAVHQADLLYLPHDKVGNITYKYTLTIVDIDSRYKWAEPLTDKTSTEVTGALIRIYQRGPLICPNLIEVDLGREFMGKFT